MTVDALGTMLSTLAVVLTVAMFVTGEAMLGFPCVIFWGLLGGLLYQQSATTWDIYFTVAFACLLGMTTFCAIGAFGLREKRDTIAETELREGEAELIDENKGDGLPELDDNLSPIKRRKERRK